MKDVKNRKPGKGSKPAGQSQQAAAAAVPEQPEAVAHNAQAQAAIAPPLALAHAPVQGQGDGKTPCLCCVAVCRKCPVLPVWKWKLYWCCTASSGLYCLSVWNASLDKCKLGACLCSACLAG